MATFATSAGDGTGGGRGTRAGDRSGQELVADSAEETEAGAGENKGDGGLADTEADETEAEAAEAEEEEDGDEDDDDPELDENALSFVAKWRGQRYAVRLPPECTVLDLKLALQGLTNVTAQRQKLVGMLDTKGAKRGATAPVDDLRLGQLALKRKRGADECEFLLVGAPEADIEGLQKQAAEAAATIQVVDDFEFETTQFSERWLHEVENNTNLERFTDSTEVHLISEPRPGKKLLVLDLDHAILDFSKHARVSDPREMMRPFLHDFLRTVYQHYDIAVWSQTHWRWLEIKLTELGLLTSADFRFLFVLDKTSMFSVTTTLPRGETKRHKVKPLQIIWRKFAGQFSERNTLAVDDLKRNFALNRANGLVIKAYYRRKSHAANDRELLYLAKYLLHVAEAEDVSALDNNNWRTIADRL